MVFNQFLINRLKEIEQESSADIMGNPQHRFEQKRNTYNHTIIASIDLSADVVDIKQLLKRLYIIELPEDIIILIKTWLKKVY